MGGEWMPVEGTKNFWTPAKEGEELIGKIVEIAEGTYGKKFTIQVIENGKEIDRVMPSHKMLQNKLMIIPLGEEVKIVYKGTQPPKVRGENPLMVYDVFRKTPIKEEKVQ